MYNFYSNINQKKKILRSMEIVFCCFASAHWTNISDIFTWIEFCLPKWFLFIVHFECRIHEHFNQNLQQWISQRHKFTPNWENRKKILKKSSDLSTRKNLLFHDKQTNDVLCALFNARYLVFSGGTTSGTKKAVL